MKRVYETSISNINISSLYDIAVFTATEDITARIQIRLTGIAGAGDYEFQITLQLSLEAPSLIVPVTVLNPGSVSSLWVVSAPLDLLTGNTITVSVIGRPADISVDTVVRISADTITASTAISNAVSGAVASGSLLIQTDYTFSQVITSTLTEDLSAVTKLWFAVKAPQDPDSASIIFLEKTAGLTIVNGSTYLAPGYGTIVVTGSSGAWIITIYIDEEATSILLGLNSMYEAAVKGLLSGNTLSIWDGECQITDGLIRTYV